MIASLWPLGIYFVRTDFTSAIGYLKNSRIILVHRGEGGALHNADYDLIVRCQGLDYWCKRVFGNPFVSAIMSD